MTGTVISFHLSRTAGFDGALSHLREVIIGSTSIGLISIKKLADLPPETLAARTNRSLEFVGVAGGKFLMTTLENVDFFKTNKTPQNVRLMLMDPFSNDVQRLTRDPIQQRIFREKIISSIVYLAEKQAAGYKFEVRFYPKVPPLRLMICDGSVTALSVYALETSGWKNAQLVFDAKNCQESLAPHFSELFNDLWERGLGFNLNLRAQALEGFLKKELVSQKPVELGMVHGRFQPFHHEHLEYILYGITHSKKCLIGITQPNNQKISDCNLAPHRGKPEGNPFSFEMRRDMISLSLDELGVPRDRYEIIPFDIDNHSASINNITSNFGTSVIQFLKLFSEWELHKKSLFEQSKFEVQTIRDRSNQFSPKNVTGTLVRELINSNRNWEDFVPIGTKAVIQSDLRR